MYRSTTWADQRALKPNSLVNSFDIQLAAAISKDVMLATIVGESKWTSWMYIGHWYPWIACWLSPEDAFVKVKTWALPILKFPPWPLCPIGVYLLIRLVEKSSLPSTRKPASAAWWVSFQLWLQSNRFIASVPLCFSHSDKIILPFDRHTSLALFKKENNNSLFFFMFCLPAMCGKFQWMRSNGTWK